MALYTRSGVLALTGEKALLAQLIKRLVESALKAVISDDLGYNRNHPTGRDGGNSRNGHHSETVMTDVGPAQIDEPRDQDATFEPEIVAKTSATALGCG
jgi:putative transposase